MKCSKCKEEYEPGQKFCLKCGNPIEEVQNLEEIQNTISLNVEEILSAENESKNTNNQKNEIDLEDYYYKEFPKDMDLSKLMDDDYTRNPAKHIYEDKDSYREPKRHFDNQARNKITGKKIKKKKYKGTVVGIVLIMFLIIIGGVVFYKVFFSHTDSIFNDYYESAMDMYNNKNIIGAAQKFKKSDEVANSMENHIKAKNMLYKMYLLNNNYDKAADVLESLTINSEQNEEYYVPLMSCYYRLGQNDKADNIIELKNGSSKISDIIDKYLDAVPVPNQGEGTFDEPINLNMETSIGYEIYYTLDGSTPTVNSIKYEKTITLAKNGEYKLKAVAVDDDGIYTKCFEGTYIINTNMEVNIKPASGNYDKPQKITLESKGDIKIYYTLDGTTPNENSTEYVEPIDMPIGNTVLSVISVNSVGIKSSVITVLYNLNINPVYSYDSAYNKLMNMLIEKNVLKYTDGNCEDGSRIIFSYNETRVIDDKAYYIINSKKIDKNGQYKKSVLYAVSTDTGSSYKVLIENNVYSIEDDLSYN